MCKLGKYRSSPDWDHIVTDSVTFLVTLPPTPLDIKGGVEAPPKGQVEHNTNCHQQYKNT
jgi:hypothetical protein